MCGGSGLGSALNPKKAVKKLVNPKDAIANGFGLTPGLGHEIGKATDKLGRATGNDKLAAHLDPFDINKGKTRVEKRFQQEAFDKATAAEAQANADAAASRRSQLEAYNADVIGQKRRRRASSVLARSGAGLSDSTNSVLAAANTYGKTTTGA